ncbi:transcriptional regulator, Spx/MgsR family protein [Yersinia rohdei]|uniref:Transcriptional regulator, Spx/MgsR family protein n=1 Tax=Yersinia rohdei TaxID=29485 RepID=A0ABN4F9Q3_YERRO|nr:ArsC family reductase [Yersinia rohdei]AJJ10683.1 transcriptional regulator, Spx/MgsR family protein [Yersinia rohdei]EEQ01986.1 Arsenate reductase and related [Yersinia rohdei ATCC 43380]MDN0094819.1 ArsC family reductase [Yersinia rohdei]CNF19169.1 A glutathione-dependent thiol reductase [Yersinia rohdei]CQJ59849.1 A glutathione-dependent thiol reductase [Yersinia rohdei]
MSDNPATPSLRLYGIKNCDTIKKARRWLEEQGIAYQFHDYRVDGLSDDLLQGFINKLGWEPLLNTRGTTWRKLPPAQREAIIDAQTAKVLMLEQPAIIKRPLLEAANGAMLLGFSIETYQNFIQQNQIATEVQ